MSANIGASEMTLPPESHHHRPTDLVRTVRIGMVMMESSFTVPLLNVSWAVPGTRRLVKVMTFDLTNRPLNIHQRIGTDFL